jgi:hypothetical protein
MGVSWIHVTRGFSFKIDPSLCETTHTFVSFIAVNVRPGHRLFAVLAATGTLSLCFCGDRVRVHSDAPSLAFTKPESALLF